MMMLTASHIRQSTRCSPVSRTAATAVAATVARVVRAAVQTQQQQQQQRRTLASKPPGSNPLDVLLKECTARSMCDVDGSRLPGTHWVFYLAATPPSIDAVRADCFLFALLFHSHTRGNKWS
jgi:hypothetical protein